MTPQELIQSIENLENEESRRRLIRRAVEQGMSYSDLQTVFNHFAENDPYSAQVFELELELARWEDTTNRVADERARQSDIDAQVTGAVTDPNSDGGEVITEAEAEQARAAGASSTVIPDRTEPKWVLDLTGQPMTPDAKQRLVDYVNFFYGASFGSFEELVRSGYLDEPTAQNMQDVQAAITDDEVYQSFSWNTPSGDLFTVRADQWQAAQEKYGLDEVGLKGIVNIADKLGARDQFNKISWQPVVALAAATDLLPKLQGKAVPSRIVGGPGSTDAGITPQRRTPASMLEGDPAKAMFERNPGENLNMNVLRGEGIQLRSTLSFREVYEEYEKGLQRFNYDPAMAYIYAIDPTLAIRIAGAGGDPSKVRGRDMQRVADIARAGGLVEEEWWAQSGMPLLSNFFAMEQANANRQDGGGDGGGGSQVVRQTPDPVALNEQMKALYQSMFLEEPDEATLAAFRSKINAAVQGAQPGEEIDVSARAREFAKNDPRYGELYGNKPSSLTDEEYQGQFRAAQASMLGNELAGNQAVAAGMRSGSFQTTIGAAAGTKQAWDNSTFLGRLARIGQLVGEMT